MSPTPLRRCLFSLALCYSLLLTLRVTAQNNPSVPRKLSLSAALVLTPEFCATESKKGHERFAVGKAACTELGPTLKNIFTNLTRVDDSSKAGDAQVVLEPRFADVGATQKAFAFSKRELVVLVEWTVRDQSEKAVWIETVQGSAARHGGNAFTYRSNLKHIVKASVQDMADRSAAAMSSSVQLLQLSPQPVNGKSIQ